MIARINALKSQYGNKWKVELVNLQMKGVTPAEIVRK